MSWHGFDIFKRKPEYIYFPLTVTWTAVTGATSYEVWYHTANNSGGDSGFSPVVSGTPASVIYMYATSILYNGNLKGLEADARTGADAIAVANLPVGLAGKTAHAFISISATDCIANMPATFGFPNTIPVKSATDTAKIIADNWAGLLDGDINMPLQEALIMPDSFWWWSGSTVNGNYDGSCANCNGWTSNLNTVTGVNGLKNNSFNAWIHDGTLNGNNLYYVICIAY